MSTKTNILSIPKIDLHCHLDGSLSYDFVKERCSDIDSIDRFKDKLCAPADCASLTEYLTCFDLPISLLQTKKNITAAVLDVIKQASADGVKYIEIRFAPTFSVNDSMTYNDVCEAAITGCKEGLKKYNVYSNIILCAMRHLNLETNRNVIKCAREFLGDGIAAIDLAGDESAFDNALFTELFSEARKYDIPFTIHSGECGSVKNVELALSFGAKRVGHGIALINDKNLMEKCLESKLGLELCPTSNYQTRAVIPGSPYPLKTFLDFGLLATVNTDNRTVSETTMTNELEVCLNNHNITEDDLIKLYKNSIEIAFASDEIKHNLLNFI